MKWKARNAKTSSIKKITAENTEDILKLLLENRGITKKSDQDAFLHPNLKQLDKNFFDKEQLTKAVTRIKKALQSNEQIIVYTDYDVDGITGGAILWETLKSLGANVMPHVPDRFSEGYGLSEIGIDTVLEKYPDTTLVITVDQGITKVKETEYAQEKGIDVIVTDHHTKPEILPNAHSIIHTTELSGSGVAYVFCQTLLKNVNIAERLEFQDHIGLAAMGTIADLVPLTGANRVVAALGLTALNNTKRPGIKALVEISGIADKIIDTYEIGFVLGPRINASGRLDSGLEALRLLCTKSSARAYNLAMKLDQLNKDRQRATYTAVDSAAQEVEEGTHLIFIGSREYHEGVIGLVAGQLTEQFYRPSIVLSYKDDIAKGSARSIKGVNIIELIRGADDLLLDVGGHPMAAGFSVKRDKVDALEKRLKQLAKEYMSDSIMEKELALDMELPLSAVSKKLLDTIQELKPFGVGNPRPVFVSYDVAITHLSTVGKDSNHLKLTLGDDVEAIGFGMGEYGEQLSSGDSVAVAYTLDLNVWNGNETLQLILKDIIS